ncbi:MAG: GNAT family N-acetyltransferase [Candidatus Ventricola sp.]
MTTIERTMSTDEGIYTSMSYVMTLDGQEIGWASLTVDENSAYCDRIDIDEAHRNQGHGTALLRALSSEFGSIFVAPDNADAQRLYDRIGWDVSDKDDWWAVDQGFGVYEI